MVPRYNATYKAALPSCRSVDAPDGSERCQCRRPYTRCYRTIHMNGPPTSVILPTVRETDVVDEIAEQLGSDDELLVVCDADSDPIAGAADSLPESVRLVVAGEPEGCSG